MSVLLDYLDRIEEEVKKWPEWKHESLKNAFQIPRPNKMQRVEKFYPIVTTPNNIYIPINQ